MLPADINRVRSFSTAINFNRPPVYFIINDLLYSCMSSEAYDRYSRHNGDINNIIEKCKLNSKYFSWQMELCAIIVHINFFNMLVLMQPSCETLYSKGF